MDAQLVGQAIERLHQRSDLLRAAARLRQRRGERRRRLWAKRETGLASVRQRQGRLGNLIRWPSDRGGQEQSSQTRHQDRGDRDQE